MNPFLIGGIVTLGKQIIDSVVGDRPPEPTVQQKSEFNTHMSNLTQKISGSPVAQLLVSENINTAADLSGSIDRISNLIAHNPLVFSVLGGVNPSEGLSLKKDESGGFSLVSGEGRNLKLPPGSDIEILASKLHTLKSLEKIQPQNTGIQLIDLATKMQDPVKSEGIASWVLRKAIT